MPRYILLFFALITFSFSAFAIEPIYSSWGKAIKGYDPVAYFTEGQPVKGDKAFTHEWNGAKWFFASKQHADLFKADPEKYAPQYGGYCAWAVSQGSTAKIDPKAWSIVDGKLYLNYNKKIQARWEQDANGNIIAADKNWPKILNK